MTERTNAPATLDELRLPPSFVADHAIRTLGYQGALSVLDMAKHWHVHDAVAADVVDSLKAAGIVRSDAGPTDFDRLGRVRLTETGQARLATARERTWYAGPLPVSLARLDEAAGRTSVRASRETLREKMLALEIDERAADEMGQALAGGRTMAIAGVADDEQAAIAAAAGGALEGETQLPFAIFAAGAVIRVFDPQHHRTLEHEGSPGETLDVLRGHGEARSQWATVRPPVVQLAGGVLPSDVTPAYDEEARFYLAPPPCAAWGGVLCVLDSAVNGEALIELANTWLIPGRQGVGIIKLRTGERIELPWQASVMLLNAGADALPPEVRRAVPYYVDITQLEGGAMEAFVHRRLGTASDLTQQMATSLATLLEQARLTTRVAAATAAQYLRDRMAYDGAAFDATATVLRQAVEFAADEAPAPRSRRRAA
ncbi:MAG TPA: hypothetical protein VEZ14_14940 [Dehalococcoidia bacterium]|nr:hypothetical protein [Dehalococcoidia bacterium]